MADTDYYESHFGSGVLTKVQYKEITDDEENVIEHEINLGCASRLLNDLDESLVGLVFFETSDSTMINQIKNHDDLVEHINTY
tara:strand:- start:63 stop:311 length:249 start_codon:yes stop_codon:yes gene_type:complete